MRFHSSIVTLLLAALLVCGVSASAQKSSGKGTGQGKGTGRGEGRGQGGAKPQPIEEKTATAIDTVNVTLTTSAGKITVRGWDRKEVHAETHEEGTKIELRKTCAPGDEKTPASRVDVLVANGSEGDPDYNEADTDSDISLDVPRGATVFLKTQDGDIEVADVAEVHVETSGGRVDLRRVARGTEVTSVGGDITLEESSGRARLGSLGGSIEVSDFRAETTSDFLKTKTVSGDILLEQIGPARVEANTISGEVKLEGALARGGVYDFLTTTGDVTLVLPTDSSFKLTAKVSENGEIVTEFPLKYKGSTSPFTLMQTGRLLGTYGTGDATINLVSFSGTLRLRKR